MKKFFFLFLLPIVSGVYAQEAKNKEVDPSVLVDEIFATQDATVNYEQLYENFLQLLSHPLDLNTVTDEQLRGLYILSQQQISAFLAYRKETGRILSEYELQTILDETTFLKIIPFVKVNEESESLDKRFFQRIISAPNPYLLLRWGRTLEEQKGYSESATPSNKYSGNPDNMYVRFRASRAGDFSAGMTLKKDAGELLKWDAASHYYGFDYVSFHVQALNKGRIKNLVLGDYQAQFAQGITLGSVFGIGKNGETINTMRRPNVGFTPYTSLYEAGYFRGAALSYSLNKDFTLHALTSFRGRDGSLQTDSLSDTGDFLSSFSFTGLHRTAKELANRNVITESNEAMVIQFKREGMDAGLIGHHTHFSSPLQRSATIYNAFQFNGSDNTNVGAYLNYNLDNVAFFSEYSQTMNHGKALVAGVLASLTSKLETSLVYRQFDRNFYSFYSNAIAENSVPQNEEGIYWGLKYSFNKKISAAGYVDWFNFPWLKYRSYSPSEGNEWLVRFNWRPYKTVYFFVQMREETKQRNAVEAGNLYTTHEGTKRSYWINCDYAASLKLRFKTRWQLSEYQLGNSLTNGMVLLQDVTYVGRKASVSGRFAIFDTDDYDNRLYVHEKDAWLAFSFPAYFGKGVRQMLMLQYKLTEKVDVWLRWACTSYLNQEIIGSGGDQINGSSRNDIKFQARIRL
jgi:hypothetical protein